MPCLQQQLNFVKNEGGGSANGGGRLVIILGKTDTFADVVPCDSVPWHASRVEIILPGHQRNWTPPGHSCECRLLNESPKIVRGAIQVVHWDGP